MPLAPVHLRVPATTANLGPGYDVLGLALQIYNQFVFTPAERLSLTLSGSRAAECHFELDPTSLVWQAFARVYQLVGQPAPAFALTQLVEVPPARGLGSSSTAIVAGLLAANAWLDQPFDQAALLALATELEGHPDNVAPALLGGCVLNLPHPAQPRWTHLPVPPALHWGVCIPAFELPTHQARSVVPTAPPLQDAVANLAYISSLVAGFCLQRPDLLALGLQDRLHQPYRRALVPGMQAVMQAAQAQGALGCVLSGAGPSLLVVATEPVTAIGAAMCQAWQQHDIDAVFVPTALDTQGAQLL